VVEGITVVKFRMNDGGGNGRSCFGIEVRADATNLTNWAYGISRIWKLRKFDLEMLNVHQR